MQICRLRTYPLGILIAACIAALACAGQSDLTAPNAEEIRFAAEPYIIRSFATHTTMHADGTGMRDQTVAIHLQSEAALRLFGILSLNFAKSSQTAEFLYARVRRPDGSVTETPVTDAQEQPAPTTLQAPTYSDLTVKQLPLRSLHVGDTLEWQTRVTVLRPEIPNQFWGQESYLQGAVVLAETHQLTAPAAAHLIVWTNPDEGGRPAETTGKGQHTWTWHHTLLQPTVGADAEARKAATARTILSAEQQLNATQGALPTLAWTTFADWQAVGAWYGTLIAGQNTADEAIRAKVLDLTAGKATTGEKAQAIYAYVSTQIRYIAVSFGVGRYKPHTAAEIFRNQFGDCKDKHTLLSAMLNVIGVEADPALIGAGIRFNTAVPSPAAFNHLITRATVNGSTAWLDSTNEVAPWRALMPGLRDHTALVLPVSTTAALETTPAELPYPPTLTATVKESLDERLNSDADMTYVFHDDTELALRLALRRVPASSYSDAVQHLMTSFGLGGITSGVRIEHLDDTSQPLTVRFSYHRDHDSSWGRNRVTVPFAPSFLPAFSFSNPPVAAIQLGGPRTTLSLVDLTLPPGWSAVVPKAVHEPAAFATGEEAYRLQGQTLRAEKRVRVVAHEVPATMVDTYEQWLARSSAGSVPYLMLVPPAEHRHTR